MRKAWVPKTGFLPSRPSIRHQYLRKVTMRFHHLIRSIPSLVIGLAVPVAVGLESPALHYQQGVAPTANYAMHAASVRSLPNRQNFNDHQLLVGFIDSSTHRIESRAVLSFPLAHATAASAIRDVQLVCTVDAMDAPSVSRPVTLAVFALDADVIDTEVSWLSISTQLGSEFQRAYQEARPLSVIEAVNPKTLNAGQLLVFPGSPELIALTTAAVESGRPLRVAIVAIDPDPAALSLRTLVRLTSNEGVDPDARPLLRIIR